MNHHIHLQRWQVKAPSQEAAFAIRRQLRSQLDTMLLPVFERAFDVLDVGDEVVRIPRLTLDLKLRPDEDFVIALADALHDRLIEVLQEVVVAHPKQTGVQRFAVHVSLRKRLLNYLTSGQLEWHEHAEKADNLVRALQIEAMAFSKEQTALPDVISGSLAQRINAGFRLLQLLPEASRPALLALAPLRASLPARLPAITDATLLPVLLRELAESGVIDSYPLLRVQAMLLALQKEDLHFPLTAQILALLHEYQIQLTPHASATALSSLPEQLTRAEATRLTVQESADGATADSTKLDFVRPVRTTNGAPAAVYTANDAGLILLHPFLPRLFDAVGIVELPEVLLPRAAALLHWLVNGREEIYEFELTTIKALLGLAPDQALLVGSGLLSEADRFEADILLAAAISHWGALGKTSVAALRSSFLQRRGLLRDTDVGWQLQVEPESHDLLLGKLPWSIGIVKLPWMTRTLFTEWIAP